MTRMADAMDRTILMSLISDKPALEGYHGHGVFTYALLDGLSHADRDNDGMIEISELAGYVDRTVPEITEKAFRARQRPLLNIRGFDFVLAKKTDGLVESDHFSGLKTPKDLQMSFRANSNSVDRDSLRTQTYVSVRGLAISCPNAYAARRFAFCSSSHDRSLRISWSGLLNQSVDQKR